MIELYVRLHDLDKDSLFHELEGKGWVNHQIPVVSSEEINNAMSAPPAGRATRRAQLIRRHWRKKGISISWDTIRDGSGSQSYERPINAPDDGAGREAGCNDKVVVFCGQVQNAAESFRLGYYHKCIELLEPEFEITDIDSTRKRAELQRRKSLQS